METGGGPTVTATDGGNLIPPAYSATLFQKMGAVTNLYDQLQDEPFTGNTLEVPIVNETGATNGVIAYWTTEANAITDSTLPTDMVTLKLNNLCALVNVTDQLLDDNAYSLDNFLNQHVPMKMVYKLNGDVLYGTGGGANVIGAASTIAVSRNTSSRILFADIIAMYSRMAEWCLPNAKWYISPSVLPELFKLSFPDASGSFPLFVPTGQAGGYPSVQYQSPGFLYGKEVVLCSNMQALGNKGDILFADLSQTSKIQKGLDSKMTPFLYFDKAISTLRFILRVDSACRWATTWTRPDGVTESPQIVLTGNSVVPN
jgi:HK97 family phage major capsid protein